MNVAKEKPHRLVGGRWGQVPDCREDDPGKSTVTAPDGRATETANRAVDGAGHPIAFGNFKRGYLITDRTGVRILRDPFTNKPYVHFYSTKRVGGGLVDSNAIKLLKCATS